MPSLEELVRKLRRQPFGNALADICHDLGVSPALCSHPMWDLLFDGIWWCRGNLAKLILELRRREVSYQNEADRNRALGWTEEKAEALHESLGFWIGEEPVLPPLLQAQSASVTAEATGPP